MHACKPGSMAAPVLCPAPATHARRHLLVGVEAEAGEERALDDGVRVDDAQAAQRARGQQEAAVAQQGHGREQQEAEDGDDAEQVDVVQRALQERRAPLGVSPTGVLEPSQAGTKLCMCISRPG